MEFGLKGGDRLPIYVYKCRYCGHEFEELVLDRKNKVDCPKCGLSTKRIPSVSNFIVNGYNEKNGYSKKKGE